MVVARENIHRPLVQIFSHRPPRTSVGATTARAAACAARCMAGGGGWRVEAAGIRRRAGGARTIARSCGLPQASSALAWPPPACCRPHPHPLATLPTQPPATTGVATLTCGRVLSGCVPRSVSASSWFVCSSTSTTTTVLPPLTSCYQHHHDHWCLHATPPPAAARARTRTTPASLPPPVVRECFPVSWFFY